MLLEEISVSRRKINAQPKLRLHCLLLSLGWVPPPTLGLSIYVYKTTHFQAWPCSCTHTYRHTRNCEVFTALVGRVNWGEQGRKMKQTKPSCSSQLYSEQQTIYTLWVKKRHWVKYTVIRLEPHGGKTSFSVKGTWMTTTDANSLLFATAGHAKTHSMSNSMFWRNWSRKTPALFLGVFSQGLINLLTSLHSWSLFPKQKTEQKPLAFATFSFKSGSQSVKVSMRKKIK